MSDRDLAEAIYAAITGPAAITEALSIWEDYPDQQPRQRMALALSYAASGALNEVLARRQAGGPV